MSFLGGFLTNKFNMTEKPNFYALIPATVRYDKRLTANAKLLYGEITALSDKSGYCWANNAYFSELYSVSSTSISKWVSSLIKLGYIKSVLEYKENSKEIFRRYLSIVGSVPVSIIDEKPIKDEKEDKNTEKIDFDSLLMLFNKITNKGFKVINSKARKQFNDRLKEGYSKSDILKAIQNCSNDDYHKANPKYLTPEFISRPDKFDKYLLSDNKNAQLPDDWFNRELTNEQIKLLTTEQMKSWRMNKMRHQMDGGKLKPIIR